MSDSSSPTIPTPIPTPIRIAALSPPHREAWNSLFAAYAEFYQTSLSPQAAEQVWQWLGDGELHGLIAEDNGELAGFAHWAATLRPLHGCRIAYLHDLFVRPESRGKQIGAQLVAAAGEQAQQQGCKLMRWATAADNHTARKLYDRIAKKTEWKIYEQRLGDD